MSTTRMRCLGYATVLVASAWLAACDHDDRAPHMDGDCYVEQSHPVSDRAVKHACIHIDKGPHDSRMASASPEGAEPLSQSHTAYTVQLVEADGAWAGFVPFTSELDTLYSFYFDGQVPVQIEDGEGTRLCPATRHSLDACAGLQLVEVHALRAGQTIWIAFGPGAHEQATVVLERY